MKRKNHTKYIATRETVEKREQNSIIQILLPQKNKRKHYPNCSATFPKQNTISKYEDCTAHPTVQNASEMITTIIKCHADVIGNRQNFIGYMAKRPGAKQRGAQWYEQLHYYSMPKHIWLLSDAN